MKSAKSADKEVPVSALHSAACRIALIGAGQDQFCDRDRLEAFFGSLPRQAWLRVLDTDHFFSGALEDLAESCRDVITWARGEEGG